MAPTACRFLWVGGLAGASLAAAACGPSFQAVYEGDVRFEHCYALDQGPAAAAVKKTCWRQWLHEDTYGQSRDRVEYAGTRFSELSLDPTLPTEEREAARAHPLAAPVPTNAFAPPPTTAEHASGAGETAPAALASATPSAPPPGQECAEDCTSDWKTCHGACKEAACDACDKAYKLCVPGCFRK